MLSKAVHLTNQKQILALSLVVCSPCSSIPASHPTAYTTFCPATHLLLTSQHAEQTRTSQDVFTVWIQQTVSSTRGAWASPMRTTSCWKSVRCALQLLSNRILTERSSWWTMGGSALCRKLRPATTCFNIDRIISLSSITCGSKMHAHHISMAVPKNHCQTCYGISGTFSCMRQATT